MATSPGTIGRYQVVRRLGVGGMGSVFLARDPDLDRDVAIKLVKDDLTDDPELRERFSREARSAARLRHPNIVTIFDIGEQDGQPFIAMEYVPGESLSDLVRRKGPLNLGRVLTWMESLCGGLAHAHRAGIVHRDIKPANVMIDADGVLKIVDFGIARLADSHMTKEGVLVGTINYMAPEQILGAAADHRADIFAVGAVFYEVLSFQKAFPGSIADGLFTRICHEPAPSLDVVCPGLDPGIVAIVGRALEKDPARRYQDLTLMAREVAGVRTRLEASGALGATVTIAPADRATVAGPAPTPYSGSRPGIGSPTPPPTDPSVQRLLVELEQARDRTERVRRSIDEARHAYARQAYETAIAAGEAALAVDPAASEARDIVVRARAAVEERQRQSAVDAARRIVDAARAALEAGDDSGALELLDALRAPNEALAEAVADLRARIGETQTRRQRRAGIFVDAAELAISQGDFTRAASLLDDAARVDAALPAIATLRAQVDEKLAADRAADARRQESESALREAEAALARGDLAGARRHGSRALTIDPQNWQASTLLSRVQQAERVGDQRDRMARQDAAAAAGRRGRTWVIVAVLVLAGAVALVYLLTR